MDEGARKTTVARILVIEDDKQLATMLAAMLTQNGAGVTQAFDGEEGLRLATEMRHDLILLDIEIPKFSGTALLKRLRASGNKTPVIILSNSSRVTDIADATGLGVTEYLVKSDWEIDVVAKRIVATAQRYAETR